MEARHSRPGPFTSRTDPASRCSSLFYCSLDPGGFFYSEPMAVRIRASANALISTTTTTTTPQPQEFLNRPGMVSFKGLPRKLDEHNRRQHINAINGDRVMDFAFRSLEANFGIQVPPIFNVCPHSTHRIFPRINIDDALAELANGRARPPAAARSCEQLGGYAGVHHASN